MTIAVEFQQLSRNFDQVRAVDQVNLQIEEGEFFSMLGPSGSGKTTCLRLIAGFEQPSAGSVRIFGQEAAGVPPYRRDVNTVFQDYALFPHMSVLDNVAYGLMVKGVGKSQRQEQANAMSEGIQPRQRLIQIFLCQRWRPRGLSQSIEIKRSTRLGPGTRFSFTTKRLYADDSTNHIAVDIDIASLDV